MTYFITYCVYHILCSYCDHFLHYGTLTAAIRIHLILGEKKETPEYIEISMMTQGRGISWIKNIMFVFP